MAPGPALTSTLAPASMDWRWLVRIMRLGFVLLFCFETIYFLIDAHQRSQVLSVEALSLHVVMVAASILILVATWFRWFKPHWRKLVFATVVLVFAASAGLTLITGQTQPLFVILVMALLGAAALMPWSTGWQGALAITAVGAMIVPALALHSHGVPTAYYWFGIMMAAALGQFMVVGNQRHRRELASWMESVEAVNRRLRQSEAELRKVLEASGDAISISRLSDGRYIDFNQCFCDVTGYARAEALGHTAIELGFWPQSEPLKQFLRILRSKGQVRNFECAFRMKGGGLAQHLLSASLMELDGELCIVAASRDVTEIKHNEEELRIAQRTLSNQVEALHRSQERLHEEIARSARARQQLQASETKLRKVFETSNDMIVISRFPDHHLVDCNPEFLAFSGLSRKEALSLSIEEMGIWRRPAQYSEFLRRLRESGFVRSMEVEIGRRDGSATQFLVSATLTKIDGHPHLVTMARDITGLKKTEHDLRAAKQTLLAQVGALSHTQERLRAEITERESVRRRLAHSERKFRRVFESSLDAITIIDIATWQIIDCNSELTRVLGYERQQIIGRTSEELNAWASRHQLREVTRLLFQTGAVRNLEVEVRHSSGVIVPYLASAVVTEIEGRPCVLALTRDISRLKHTERELTAAREAALAASQAKSEFLSSMSHEIRTPMNAILGMADLLWETALDTEQRRYLHTMRANGNTLLSLVDDILDLAKVESGRLQLERSECDVVQLTEGAIETPAIRAHEKGLELALLIRPEVPVMVMGDSLRLRQILINLLGNAIKFTDRGEVTLTVEVTTPELEAEDAAARPHPGDGATDDDGTSTGTERRLLRFSIHDTGIGIPDDKINAIFANFTQADSTTTRKYGGSGLGLAIVKRLVDLMGGQLTVESHPDRGSTFAFIVPFEVQLGVTTILNQTREVQGLAAARILVVDDSPASRQVLSETLTMGGAAVTVTGDGTTALAEIERARTDGRPYDLVLADCSMEAPDGVAIGRHLHSAAVAPPEPLVLMLSTDDLPARLAKLRDLGFGESASCYHLIKPIRRADLFSIVTAACSGALGRGDGAHAGPVYTNGSAAHPLTASVPGLPGSSLTAPSSPPLPAPDNAPSARDLPYRILLAEDSPDNRLVIEAYLRNSSYILDHAENGEIVVDKFITGSYDAVLMDIQMPVMDGHTATAKIRRWERDNHRQPTPIIALTASAEAKTVRKSLEMGCDAHVTKPVKRATLLKAIKDAIEACAPSERLDESEMSMSNKPPCSQTPVADHATENGDAANGELNEPIVVHIDEDLRDILPGFLERKRADARAILAAAEHGDGESISRMGHKLKGEGGGFGLDAISALGRKLEEAAAEGGFNAAAGLARDLISFLDRLEIVYQPMED